ncbi:MAG: DUF1059 domain-containing protein [Dehalococcoidia bacterium]
MKEFSCGDVVPGCGARFQGDTEDDILAQVARHAAAVHGIAAPDAELVEVVRSKIRVAA